MNLLQQRSKSRIKELSVCLAMTFLWGVLAYGYGFFDNSFSHDSLNEFHGQIYGNLLKIESGRVFTPVYRWLFRGDITVPWLIWALSLIFLGLTLFLITRILRMESKWEIFLTAGILTANMTVTAIGVTYLHDLDCYLFSLLAAAAGVWLWQAHPRGWLPGGLCVALSLGMYQGFFCVAITLVVMVCILDLLDGKAFRCVFFRGLKALGMLALGGVLYILALRIIPGLAGTALRTGDYNTMDRMSQLTPALFLDLAVQAWKNTFYWLFRGVTEYPSWEGVKIIAMALTALCAAALGMGLASRRRGWPEKLLLLALGAVLPLGMNLIYVLNLGMIHELMIYAVWLFYLLALLLGDHLAIALPKIRGIPLGKLTRGLCGTLVLVLLWGNVRFANELYLKKDMEYDAYLSLMTRMVYRMEDHEDYTPGETPVCFVGLPENLNQTLPGFEIQRLVSGADKTDVIWGQSRSRFWAYLNYVMGLPIQLAEEQTWNALQTDPQTAQMPCYPAQGCVAMIADVLVVKLGD